MTGRERFLCTLSNGKPDRLPCQVHSWMGYYLKTYLGGMDQYEAYAYFDMDPVIYINPNYIYDPKDLANWQVEHRDLGVDRDGRRSAYTIIRTPEGDLTERTQSNAFTGWSTEHLIKDEHSFELWNKYVPVPVFVDWSEVAAAKERIGDGGIVRGAVFNFGQGSPWQSFCHMFGTVNAIMATYDNPEWVRYALDSMLDKTITAVMRGGIEYDLAETGGGAGSSTVISPRLHEEFCLPYDRKQHKLIHEAGAKVVYHLCGGLMPLLETVAGNGADGLETMTPPGMGGDCDLEIAGKQVGDKLFFIGGFDQGAGFERGDPEVITEMVHALHSACPDGGYICCPSDHFFFGDPENVRAFVRAAKECRY